MTATLIGQQKIARTDGTTAGVATLDRAVPALLVENVTKRFFVGRKRKPVTAIANVSLRLERGDIVGSSAPTAWASRRSSASSRAS